MRDAPVPCVNATEYEVMRGEHLTWLDAPTCPRCDTVLDRFATRRLLAEPVVDAEPEQEYTP
jgi:hypothetical protein